VAHSGGKRGEAQGDPRAAAQAASESPTFTAGRLMWTAWGKAHIRNAPGSGFRQEMDELDTQAAYWDAAVETKAFTHPLNLERFGSLLSKDAAILDYGCGYGRLCAELADAGYLHVTGVDISSRMIERGRALFPGMDLRRIAGAALPFAAEVFDACLLFAVLTCVPTDAGQQALIAELRRVLRPGGILYVSDYPLQTNARNQERYRAFAAEYGRFGVFRLPDGATLRHHDMHWIHALLDGLDLLHEDVLAVRTMNGNPAKAFQILARRK
jgi:SAM-dependent methyltransferase